MLMLQTKICIECFELIFTIYYKLLYIECVFTVDLLSLFNSPCLLSSMFKYCQKVLGLNNQMLKSLGSPKKKNFFFVFLNMQTHQITCQICFVLLASNSKIDNKMK